MPSVCFCLSYVLSLCLGLLCLLFVTFWSSHWRGGFSWDGSALEFNWHPVLMVSGLLVLYGYGKLLCCWSILHYIWYDMCVLFNLPLVDVKGVDKGKEMKARAHLVLLLLILPQYHRRDNNNTDHVLPNWPCNNKIIKINVKKKKKGHSTNLAQWDQLTCHKEHSSACENSSAWRPPRQMLPPGLSYLWSEAHNLQQEDLALEIRALGLEKDSRLSVYGARPIN